MRIDLFFVGYCRFFVDADQGNVLFSVLEEAGIPPKAIKRDEKNGEISFSCSLGAARRFCAAAGKKGLTIKSKSEGGLPILAKRFLGRPGLVFGTVTALFLLITAQLFVWDVRVEGNESLSTAEIEQALAQAGLAKGSFMPRLDTEALCASVRAGDARVAYVSVNLRGAVAYVQIRESAQPSREGSMPPANLVARCDGVVTLPLAFEGECYVKPGDVVRAGQILVGGFVDSENHGARVMRAAGQIWAKTTHVYRVNVPFAYEEKVYTGRERTELSLLFFGMKGKVFKFPATNIKECDIIENTQWASIGNGVVLPIGLSRATAREYVCVPATRNALQARALALAQLEELLAADSTGRTLLERTTEVVADENGISVICTVICEEDIGLCVDIDMQLK